MLAALTLCLGLQIGLASPSLSPEARALEVFVVDEAGTLLVDGWSVRLGRLSGTKMWWHETTRVDATSGVAVFAAIDEPTNFVQAVHDTGELSACELVAFGPTAARAVAAVHRLVFDGPHPERSLFVSVSDPLGTSRAGGLTVLAIDRAGREIALRSDADAPDRYVARGVEPGAYRIEVRDPLFLPLLIERHLTGRVAAVQPVGSAALLITFVDAVDGRALTPVDVIAWTSLVTGSTTRMMSISGIPGPHDGAGPIGEARLEGLVPGTSMLLHATFERHFASSSELADLAPNETRRVTERVERARSVQGTIIDPEGAPVPGVTVATAGQKSAATPPRRAPNVVLRGRNSVRQGPSGQSHVMTLEGQTSLTDLRALTSPTPLSATCVSDGAGRFELHGLGLGPTQLEAHFTPWHREPITLPALSASTLADATASSSDARTVAEAGEAPTVRAPGPCGADLQFIVPRGMTLAHFDVTLQLGDAPWLHASDKVAPLVDEHQTMQLRGLTGAPCRLDVRLRDGAVWPPIARDTGASSLTFEFVPCAAAPTHVRVELGPLAEYQ